MTFQAQAQTLAAQGRGPDSVLVHMTPREVAGLDALARQHYGSGLTTNPKTGLPEAGILSSILPALAGAALMATGVGAPMAAMLVGGGTALATGSLGKGLMAGLGAFGGAGMGGALADMGTSAATTAASAAAPTMDAAAAATSSLPAAETAATWADPEATFANTAAPSGWADPEATVQNAGAGAMGNSPQEAFRTAEIGGQNAMGNPAANMSQWDKMQAGMQDMTQPGGFNRFIQAQGGGMKAATNGLMALQGGAGLFGQHKPLSDDSSNNSYIRPYSYDPNGQRFTPLPIYPASQAPQRFASGGIAELMDKGSDANQSAIRSYIYNPVNQQFTRGDPNAMAAAAQPAAQAVPAAAGAPAATPGGMPPYNPGNGPVGAEGANGGAGYMPAVVAAVDPGDGRTPAKYAGGGISGLLQGPGDGTSDSIPAQMPGGQPAALGDGEFVIPARIVSEIGNGSSKAGASALYDMMQRIEKKRKAVPMAGNSQAQRFLPA